LAVADTSSVGYLSAGALPGAAVESEDLEDAKSRQQLRRWPGAEPAALSSELLAESKDLADFVQGTRERHNQVQRTDEQKEKHNAQ
jgi:hypothetical protein